MLDDRGRRPLPKPPHEVGHGGVSEVRMYGPRGRARPPGHTPSYAAPEGDTGPPTPLRC
jgi:hypothetical protein